MTENVFIKKLKVLYEGMLDKYYKGEELDRNVKAVELLCHNFLEMKRRAHDKTSG